MLSSGAHDREGFARPAGASPPPTRAAVSRRMDPSLISTTLSPPFLSDMAGRVGSGRGGHLNAPRPHLVTGRAGSFGCVAHCSIRRLLCPLEGPLRAAPLAPPASLSLWWRGVSAWASCYISDLAVLRDRSPLVYPSRRVSAEAVSPTLKRATPCPESDAGPRRALHSTLSLPTHPPPPLSGAGERGFPSVCDAASGPAETLLLQWTLTVRQRPRCAHILALRRRKPIPQPAHLRLEICISGVALGGFDHSRAWRSGAKQGPDLTELAPRVVVSHSPSQRL
ncbi:hypothetical protein JHW43_000997 [Diplocarpon mali]|nr:hypothetical protein JHW43_000997 [Diplocarpon mali]